MLLCIDGTENSSLRSMTLYFLAYPFLGWALFQPHQECFSVFLCVIVKEYGGRAEGFLQRSGGNSRGRAKRPGDWRPGDVHRRSMKGRSRSIEPGSCHWSAYWLGVACISALFHLTHVLYLDVSYLQNLVSDGHHIPTAPCPKSCEPQFHLHNFC